MNKSVLGLFLMVFPVLAMASGDSLSFAPPPSDYSVVFLANIFGIVDGVLHGSGSQIMGTMFGVFNAAVLALGGIVITYTLLVSTVNTAHEGQMLGQKWSSMWVPIRATLGLALLIPKASGYCMMQIFVMWVVVQGVGAADKVWNSALSYLNRGGVVVQQQINPVIALTGGGTQIAQGAAYILSSQVCMLGIEQVLTTTRQGYLTQQGNKTGPCYVPPGQQVVGDSIMTQFCNMEVPSFLSSFNAIAVQNVNKSATQVNKVPLPNFDITQKPYNTLNGICGMVAFAPFNVSSLGAITTLGAGEIDTMKKSRAIAVQQLYMDLSTIAQIMVNNNPGLTLQSGAVNTGTPTGISAFSGAQSGPLSNPATPLAQQPFGVPLLNTGQPCTKSIPECTGWGNDGTDNGTALFNGTEFQGAISDYNAIMLPTLNLVNQANNSKAANAQRQFIKGAQEQGWIVAGSYFFDLVSINNANMSTGGATDSGTPIDTDSQLQTSTFDAGNITSSFDAPSACTGDYTNLCTWMQHNPGNLNNLAGFFDGSSLNSGGTSSVATPNVNPLTSTATVGPLASTVYGYINNSVIVVLPGQPGNAAPQFVMKLIPNLVPPKLELPKITFPCWRFVICWGKLLGAIFYDLILKIILMWVLNFVNALVNLVVVACLILPLQGMAKIFQHGVAFLQQPNINPVVALANMGVNYINFANDMWLYVIDTSVMASLFGPFVITLIALIMPLLMAWLATMMALGFITAYYIPFLPYMIFTFGAIGWLMAVIEAMVAAPIVALGITHPEGEGPFGKGEQAIMILMNVFLRPALMIVGYIAAIILSYVGIWVINAGFAQVVVFIQGTPEDVGGIGKQLKDAITTTSTPAVTNQPADQVVTGSIGYGGWAGIYGFFFSILIYTTMYLTVVQKSFTLITSLPDKVLRWIGGQPESIGGEAAGWAEDSKKAVTDAGEKTQKASAAMSKQLAGKAGDKLLKGDGEQPAPRATPMPPE